MGQNSNLESIVFLCEKEVTSCFLFDFECMYKQNVKMQYILCRHFAQKFDEKYIF